MIESQRQARALTTNTRESFNRAKTFKEFVHKSRCSDLVIERDELPTRSSSAGSESSSLTNSWYSP
jgi:hypothetical protein